MVEVDVRTGCGRGAERKYVSSALIFIVASAGDDTLARPSAVFTEVP
jgi:hypothetical protein